MDIRDLLIRRGPAVHRFWDRDDRSVIWEAIARQVDGVREACAVDRVRCAHCRNPVKPHHVTSGPPSAEGSYHEDCWAQAQAQTVESCREQQLDYERRVASGGLAALLSPYGCVLPEQREVSAATPEPVALPG